MNAVTPILAYDDLLQRPGIVVQQEDGFVRIVTPALGSWRKLEPTWRLGILVPAVLAAFPLLAALTGPRGDRLPPVVASLEFGVILVFVILAAAGRVYGRHVLEVTRDTFAINRIGVVTLRARRQVFRRDAIGQVHYNTASRKLFVYVTGQDLIEIPFPGEFAEVENAVEVLDRAIHANPDEIDHSLPRGEFEQAEPEHSARTRVMMLSFSAALVVTSAILLLTGVPVLWMVALFAAAVPAGITLGTQRSKFWM